MHRASMMKRASTLLEPLAPYLYRTDRRSLAINPERNQAILVWDLLLICGTAYVTITIPYKIAFDATQTISNLIVDGIFALDILLNFFLMYRDPCGNWVSSQSRICTHYLGGWFFFDVISVFPFNEFFPGKKERWALLPRMLRVLKLIRLLKIIQVSDTASRWRARITIGADVQTMVVLLTAIFTSAHWMACLWGSLATFADKSQPTWATSWVEGQVSAGTLRGGSDCLYVYTDPLSGRVQMLEPLSNGAAWQKCVSPHDLYVVSLYWAIMTLTSIGYGDVIPSNGTEYAVSIVIMFAMGIVWAYFVSSLCAITTNSDPVATQYCQRLDELNKFIQANYIDHTTAITARTYLYRHYVTRKEAQNQNIIRELSPNLQTFLATRFLTGHGLTKLQGLNFMSECDPSMARLLFWLFHRRVYTSGEVVPNDLATLFVLNTGVVMVGDVIRSNHFRKRYHADCEDRALTTTKCLWGKDFLLRNIALKEQSRVLAVTYIDVYEFRGAELRRALAAEKRRPEVLAFQHSMRKATVVLGIGRAFVRLATVVSKAQVVGRTEFRRQLHAAQLRGGRSEKGEKTGGGRREST
jgi:hypothetical protein